MMIPLLHTRHQRHTLQAHRSVFLWMFAAATLILSGCQILPMRSTPLADISKRTWSEQLEQLTHLEDWRIRGKIGYIGKDDSGSAYIDWIQSRDSFHITLTGPLGQGTTIISGNSQGARLDSNSEGTFYAGSPEELLADHTGLSLPVSEMYQWVKGMPSTSDSQKITLTENNTLARLQQGDWTIDYSDYEPQLGNLLPTRMKLRGNNVKITLVIKAWETLPEDE